MNTSLTPTIRKTKRIQEELKAVGATAFGRAKFVSRFLPQVLHENEHIKGAVYGRYAEGTGLLRWEEGMLIATDCRVIFLDRKPGFETMDELTYDVVSGVQKSYAWPFASVTLHTRIGNYTLRFGNKKCIDGFMQYVEKRRLESLEGNGSPQPLPQSDPSVVLDDNALAFLYDHDIAVLSTIDRAGNAYGAAVHCLAIDNATIGILTRAGTQKARNIVAHHQVALTLYDEVAMQTLQILGVAALEAEQSVRDKVFAALGKPRVYGEHLEWPPATALTHGAYTIIRITPTSVRFSDFSQHGPLLPAQPEYEP